MEYLYHGSDPLYEHGKVLKVAALSGEELGDAAQWLMLRASKPRSRVLRSVRRWALNRLIQRR